MEKNGVALILVLFVVCSSPVFSDQDSCEGTYEFALGMGEGVMRSSWGWGLLGFGLTYLGCIVSIKTARRVWYDIGEGEARALYFLFPVIGTGISIALPLAIEPQPAVIPDTIPEDNVDCYLEGYRWKARRRNVNSAVLGSVLGWGVVLLFGLPLVWIESTLSPLD